MIVMIVSGPYVPFGIIIAVVVFQHLENYPKSVRVSEADNSVVKGLHMKCRHLPSGL